MKKLLFIAVAIFSLNAFAFADGKAITLKELPKQAQTFIAKHFANQKILAVTVDSEIINKDYEVLMADGNKVEFNKKGEWKDVECKRTFVPEAIVPSQIKTFVKNNHSDLKVTKIERDGSKYKVELSGGLELEFDYKFNFLRYDD